MSMAQTLSVVPDEPEPEPARDLKSKKLSPEAEGDLVRSCNEKFKRCYDARQQFDKQWYINLAFYFGKQNAEWSPATSFENMRLYEPPALPWRVRMITNKIRPIIRREHAKLIKEDSQVYVLPASTDDVDVVAAQAGETISQYVFTEAKFNAAKSRAAFWACITGTSFMKTYYNQDTDVIHIDALPPFSMFIPNLQEEEIEKQAYVIHAMAKTIDWIEDTYGVKVSPDAAVAGAPLEQKMLNALGINRPIKEDSAYVKEIWIQPCKKYEEGAVVTWAGDQLLNFVEFMPFGPTYPFSKIIHIPAGRFYGASVIDDLIPLQKERNKTVSQLIEAKNKMARPQLTAVKGSLDARKMTTEPGLIIFYNPGFQEPKPLVLAGIPSYVIEELNRIDGDFDFVSGQNAITRGSNMQGIRSAAALAYLQEQSDMMLISGTNSIEEATEKTGKIVLNIVAEYWDEPHLVKVVGHNNAFEAHQFTKSDIRGNTDFHVVPGSSTPQSLAAKQAVLTEFGKLGWIKPEQVLKYSKYSETDRLYEDSQVDAKQATREFMRISESGQYLPTNDWDNHMVHYAEHSTEMRGETFEQELPQIKQLKIAHLQETRQRIMALGINPDTGQPMQAPQASTALQQHTNMGAQPEQFGAPPSGQDQGF